MEELTAHRKDVTRYAIIALVVVALIVAGTWYFRSQATARRAAFDSLLRTMESSVAQPGQPPSPTAYATEEEKDKAVAAALEKFTKDYSGTNEEALARYFIASNAVEKNELDKALTEVEIAIKNGNKDTAAVARFLKANILLAQGKDAESEAILRELLSNAAGFVSKDEVTVALARLIAKKSPDEAIKLLEPLRLSEGSTQRIASQAIEEIRGSAKN